MSEEKPQYVVGLDFGYGAEHAQIYPITTIVDGGGGKPHWTDWLWIAGFVVAYLAAGTGFLYFLRLYLRSIVAP